MTVIRSMQNGDLDQVMTIWYRGNLQAHPFVDPQYWRDHQKLVRQQISQAQVLVAVVDQDVVAFAGMVNDYLAGIFVDQSFQHRGIGQQLINVLKSRYQELLLDVYQANRQAVTFYRQCGFQVFDAGYDPDTKAADYRMHWQNSKTEDGAKPARPMKRTEQKGG